jgi:SAM-dependent methyltransferase
MVEGANAPMAAAWDGDEGADWARDWEHHDRAIRGFHLRLLEAAAVAPGEHVLDVGCGNGESTRAAARASGNGAVLGVDLSSRMLARARELALAQGLTNVTFEQADAQVHRFEPNVYDVVLSRFGAMFFADRTAAFANIARAMQPGGRLVMVAWRTLADNEWIQALRGALAVGRELPVPSDGAPGPVGLADHDAVRDVLRAAGFAGVDTESVDEPFHVGTDAEDAFEFARGLGVVRGLLEGLDTGDRARALDTLRRTLADHETAEGVLFGSAAALISARRAPA